MEVLDGSRVHPEAYEWARKMAVDALEYDDVTEDVNPAEALEEILENPEKLRVRPRACCGLFGQIAFQPLACRDERCEPAESCVRWKISSFKNVLICPQRRSAHPSNA